MLVMVDFEKFETLYFFFNCLVEFYRNLPLAYE